MERIGALYDSWTQGNLSDRHKLAMELEDFGSNSSHICAKRLMNANDQLKKLIGATSEHGFSSNIHAELTETWQSVQSEFR